jgi:hypothetical protein
MNYKCLIKNQLKDTKQTLNEIPEQRQWQKNQAVKALRSVLAKNM